MKSVRLSPKEKDTIIQSFKNHFSKNDHLWLFGSRVEATRRGGDLDLYIETLESNVDAVLKKKAAFVSELWDLLGEQKIDVVLNLLAKPSDLPIYDIAKKEGVKLA